MDVKATVEEFEEQIRHTNDRRMYERLQAIQRTWFEKRKQRVIKTTDSRISAPVQLSA